MNIGLCILAYIIGSVPFALLIGKMGYGIDLREHGSGNLGATNTFRTLGKKAGILVMVFDMLKGTLATLLPLFMDSSLHPLLVGAFAIIGHCYPVFAKFKGGKAVATSAGVLLGYEPFLFIGAILVFLLILKASKYVSLASMLGSLFTFLYAIVEYVFWEKDLALICITLFLSSFIFYRHRENISRIKNKTESKVTWI
jgi:glycerol-3-phosphate acyltransferase PlsY